MFVTKDFVFLHLPKTAGVYFESVCEADLRMPILHSRRHAKFSSLPEEHRAKPTIGIWRDPWDWYASLYFFAKRERNAASSEMVALASDGYRLGFDETVARLLRPDEDFILAYERRMEELGGWVADFECLDPTSLRRAKGSGLGLMSFLASEIFPARLDHEWRFERLFKQMFGYLGSSHPDRQSLRRAMLSPPRNASGKPGLGLAYSQRSIQLVAQAEAPLIARFGYRPPVLFGEGQG